MTRTLFVAALLFALLSAFASEDGEKAIKLLSLYSVRSDLTIDEKTALKEEGNEWRAKMVKKSTSDVAYYDEELKKVSNSEAQKDIYRAKRDMAQQDANYLKFNDFAPELKALAIGNVGYWKKSFVGNRQYPMPSLLSAGYVRVLRVIGDNEMLAIFTDDSATGGERTVLLKGVSTVGVIDDSVIQIPNVLKVIGTEKLIGTTYLVIKALR